MEKKKKKVRKFKLPLGVQFGTGSTNICINLSFAGMFWVKNRIKNWEISLLSVMAVTLPERALLAKLFYENKGNAAAGTLRVSST